MKFLPRQHYGCRVCILTEALENILREQLRVAIVGDGTCTPANYSKSCFAAEMCTLHRPAAFTGFSKNSRVFVAICDSEEGITFMGCCAVGAMPSHVRAWFPGHCLGSSFVSNLCVGEEHRGKGVGRALIQAVREQSATPLVLTIAKNRRFDDAALCNEFGVRIARLRSTYDALNFHARGENDFVVLMSDADAP